MNDLEVYFRQNDKRSISKWIHYFDIYDRHFSQFRNKEITIVEIGVSQGGSLQMWKHYFGDKAKIFGIDINPSCKQFEEENIKVFIGSQSDRKFLNEVKKAVPSIDILIDDGGHTMVQQIVSFEELFDNVVENGVYLCEDLHTSYWIGFGGGHKRKGTFIEYSKNFIDNINAYHSNQKSLKVNRFTETVNSLHYYDSVLVIEKRKMSPPYHEDTGVITFPDSVFHKQSLGKNILNKISRSFIFHFNRVLRFLRLPAYANDAELHYESIRGIMKKKLSRKK
jgi:cephalosporin hydroxylase